MEDKNDLSKVSEEDLLRIIRESENTNVPGSRYQRAVKELELRDRIKHQANQESSQSKTSDLFHPEQPKLFGQAIWTLSALRSLGRKIKNSFARRLFYIIIILLIVIGIGGYFLYENIGSNTPTSYINPVGNIVPAPIKSLNGDVPLERPHAAGITHTAIAKVDRAPVRIMGE